MKSLCPNNSKELILKGFPICKGVAIGQPYLFAVQEERVPEIALPDEKIDEEVARYYRALKASRKEILSLQQRLKRDGGNEAVAILGSHLEMMKDPLMTEQIEKQIRHRGKNTEYVFKSVITEYEEKFSKTDQFFQERLKDVRDISRRIFGHLRHRKRSSLADLQERVVVFAHELAPSDTAEAKSSQIEAFVTRSGAETSHVAIMARARGIPFVSNVAFPDLTVLTPLEVIVDGEEGVVILNPTEETRACYQKKQEMAQKQEAVQVKSLKDDVKTPHVTKDGTRVRLSVIVESDQECLDKSPLLSLSDGIGLFRTEYLFLTGGGFPSEEEQFQCYKRLAENESGFSSVIRTFDIGGDKLAHSHPSRFEPNPYLGCRAIRLMMRKEKSAFKNQLRAVLRASAFGQVSILFPMISGLSELLSAKSIVEDVKRELTAEAIPFSRSVPVGCMIEVPSAALICDLLVEHADFLSIGTNDLVQYSLAVDRNNPAMSYLYAPTHPAVLRLIQSVVQCADRAKTSISLCGEIAANPKFTSLLLGLGIRELSISTPWFLQIKESISGIRIEEAQALAKEALALTTAQEIDDLLLSR